MSVVVVGSLNMDLVARVARLPGPGETVLGDDVARIPGGKGANQAVAAARLGASVAMIGAVGTDDMGDALLGVLASEGIDASGVARVADRPSGVALVAVDEAGENQIVVAAGANATVTPEHVRAHEALIAGASVVLVQLEIPLPAVHAALELARASGVRTVLDPAPAQPLPDSLLQLVDIAKPNESEAELLTGIPTRDADGAHDAAAALADRTGGVVVVTRGAHGACWVGPDGRGDVGRYPVIAVDATAAGDAFSGALAAALAAGDDLPEALELASAAGALATTVAGASASLPRRAAVDELRAGRAR